MPYLENISKMSTNTITSLFGRFHTQLEKSWFSITCSTVFVTSEGGPKSDKNVAGPSDQH